MTVYIEYVIINNFIIDYLLLRFTYILTGKEVKRLKLIILSLIGGVFSLVFPLIRLGNFYLTLIKILFGTLLVFVSARYKNKREFYINLTVFYFLTFLLGGSIFGVYFLIGVSYSSELAVATCFLPVCLLACAGKKVVSFLYRRKHVESVIYNFEFTLLGKKFTGRGFLDTGNSLYFNDNPVILCEKKFIEKAFDDNNFYKRVEKITVNTINGVSEKYCVPLDEFRIFIGDKPNIYNKVTLSISEVKIIGADAILHPALVGVNYESNDIGKLKKVS